MTEKFSIVKKLDVEKLNKRISEFICKNWYNPYIFANTETLADLEKQMEQDLVFMNYDGKQTKFQGLIGKYQGCKMFEDYTLDFGEIVLK